MGHSSYLKGLRNALANRPNTYVNPNIKPVGSGDPVSPAPPGAALFRYHIRWSSSPDLPAAMT